MEKTQTLKRENPEENEKIERQVLNLERIDEEKTDVIEEYCG